MKLVRDCIPDLSGKPELFTTCRPEEYSYWLLEKLVEEAEEVSDAVQRAPVIEELADLIEVVKAIQTYYQITDDDIESARLEKLEKRGGFTKGFILIES